MQHWLAWRFGVGHVVVGLALIGWWMAAGLGPTVCWNLLLMRWSSSTIIVRGRHVCITERARCGAVPFTGGSTLARADGSLLLPEGHLYWWTCVSCADISFFFMTLAAGSSFGFFSYLSGCTKLKHLFYELLLHCLSEFRSWNRHS